MSKILVVNSGSSSVKFQLFEMKARAHYLLCKGMAERIGEQSSYVVYQKANHTIRRSVYIKNHRQAIGYLVAMLQDTKIGVIEDINVIQGIGHRVVHGGEEFKAPCIIHPAVIKRLTKYIELAPLHNPPNIEGIKVCHELFPELPQVAVFDTSFYHTIPDYAYMYALPYRFYKKHLIRRYGFHGTSHGFVAGEAAKILKKPLHKLRLISCHLGNGASITAVKFGKAVDTSMGFTPLEGLIMGTRSGDIDPSVIFYLERKLKYSSKTINEILNKHSGLLGISGISNDMRDLMQKYKTSQRARLAAEMFIYRIRKYIGAYAVVLGKVDAIIFTGGIGENQPFIRRKICEGLSHILNNEFIKFLVIPTNEELMIAKAAYRLVKSPHNMNMRIGRYI
ncbi:MAG: acetate kinase [Candidatus Omnitrophota bacterium]